MGENSENGRHLVPGLRRSGRLLELPMNVVSDCLPLPILAPGPGVGTTDPTASADPGAFERELEEIPEAMTGSDAADPQEETPEETPEEATPPERLPEMLVEEGVVVPPVTPAVTPPEAPEADEAPEPNESQDGERTAIPAEACPPVALTTWGEADPVAAVETTRKSEGFAGAPEHGAVSGDTHPSSLDQADTSGETGEVLETSPEPDAGLEALPVETSRTSSEGSKGSPTDPAMAAARVDPDPVPATGQVLPTTPAEAPVAPEAPRPSTLPSGVSPQLTYEAVAAPIRVLAREGGGEARIHLSPPDLGRVDVTVILEEGRVRATVVPERPEVTELLVRHLSDLQDHLAELGFGVDDLDVQTGGPRDQGRDPWQEPGTTSDAAAGSSIDVPVDEPNSTHVTIGPDGVDVWA